MKAFLLTIQGKTVNMHVPGEVFSEELGLFHYLLHWRYFVWRKKFKLTTGE